MREVIRDGGVISRDKNTEQNQPRERQHFCGGKDILDPLAKAHAKRIEKGEEQDHHNADKLLHGKADGIFRAEGYGGDNPGLRGDRGSKTPKYLAKPMATAAIVPV